MTHHKEVILSLAQLPSLTSPLALVLIMLSFPESSSTTLLPADPNASVVFNRTQELVSPYTVMSSSRASSLFSTALAHPAWASHPRLCRQLLRTVFNHINRVPTGHYFYLTQYGIVHGFTNSTVFIRVYLTIRTLLRSCAKMCRLTCAL